MADELQTKRIIDLAQKTGPEAGDNLAVDNATSGTRRILWENLLDNSLSDNTKAAPAGVTGQAIEDAKPTFTDTGDGNIAVNYDEDEPAGTEVPLQSIRFPLLPYKYTVPQITTELTETGKVPDAKIVGDEIDKFKSDVNVELNGADITIKSYYDELGSIGGSSIFKSETLIVPAGDELVSIKYYLGEIKTFYLFLLDSTNTVIEKYVITAETTGWHTFEIGKTYNTDIYIAVRNAGQRFSYTTSESTAKEYFSKGLVESTASADAVAVGTTLTFTTPSHTERFYEFSYELNLHHEGVNEKIEVLDERASGLDERVSVLENENTYSVITLTDYIMPKCYNTDGDITYIGRWFDKPYQGASYKCANADGSSIIFKVSGAESITVAFSPLSTPNYTPYFAYSIDGSAFTRQLITDTDVAMPDTGEHLVWIVVDGMGETDPGNGKWDGNVGLRFMGVTGGTLTAQNLENRFVYFVGDSIVEGINVLGTGANANVNSATSGFAWKTARKINAIPLLCGYGGTSTLGNASFHKAIEAIDYNYNGVPVNLLKPDVILIEHGTNDAARIALGQNTVADFIVAYTTLIERLAVKYPGVPILCMVPFNQALASEIKEIADSKSYCYAIETNGWGVTTSDNIHLNVNGANIASTKLSKAIEKLFTKEYFI